MPTTPVRPNDPERLGRYRVIGRLGRGGMGTVYLGTDETGRRVAIKVINLELSDDAAFNERFRREVTAARQVRRFCTAAVLDARLEGEPLYVVTEYVDGPTLEQAVRTEGPMSEGALEGLAVNIATALGAIHGAGIVHRDLKPSNVLLSSTGPRVIDFGIARAMDALGGGLTRTGQFVGTPSYIAPELMRGGPLTPAADVFSWGCVVTYAATGHAPFSGGTIHEIIHRVINEPPAIEALEPDLRALVARALDKDPARRPDAAELVRALSGLQEPTAAQPGPPSLAAPPVPPNAPSPEQTAVTAQAVPEATEPRGRRRPRGRVIGIAALATAAVAAAALMAFVQPWKGDGGKPGGAPEAGATVVRDDFADTSTGWPNASGDCAGYRDSMFLLDILAQAGNAETCTANSRATVPGHALVDVQVRLNPVTTSANWAAGVQLAATGDDRYDVVLRPDGTARLEKLVGGRGTELATAKVGGYQAGDFNRLTAELDTRSTGTRIAVWVNERKVFERTDTTRPLRRGSTGMVLYDAGAAERVAATFDDFTLSEVAG